MNQLFLLSCTSQFQNRPFPRAYPGHLTGVLLRTVGNLNQNEARLVRHLTFVPKRSAASQAKGFLNSLIQLLHRNTGEFEQNFSKSQMPGVFPGGGGMGGFGIDW